MPKEIKILLPDTNPEAFFDIIIKSSGEDDVLGYRYEIWDLEKDNPEKFTAAEYLKKKISNYSENWFVAEIFAKENNRIPILLRQKNKTLHV